MIKEVLYPTRMRRGKILWLCIMIDGAKLELTTFQVNVNTR